jgi:hypothetical protein
MHHKAILDLFNLPSQESKEPCPEKLPSTIKPIKFDDDKLEKEAEALSELVMAKVRAKVEQIKKENEVQEGQVKELISKKILEVTKPNLEKVEVR